MTKPRIFQKAKAVALQNKRSSTPAVSLRELCKGDDSLFEALEYFLLLNPARGTDPFFGTCEGWLSIGDREKEKEDNSGAAIAYEHAARIACFQGQKETTMKALNLAISSSGLSSKYASIDGILLNRLDEVFEIARLFYASGQTISPVPEKQTLVAPLIVKK